MVLLSVGVAAMEALPNNPNRVAAVITNIDTADEIVRVDTDVATVGASAIILYNRDTVKLTGWMAKQRIFIISDTATTAVNATEVF